MFFRLYIAIYGQHGQVPASAFDVPSCMAPRSWRWMFNLTHGEASRCGSYKESLKFRFQSYLDLRTTSGCDLFHVARSGECCMDRELHFFLPFWIGTYDWCGLASCMPLIKSYVAMVSKCRYLPLTLMDLPLWEACLNHRPFSGTRFGTTDLGSSAESSNSAGRSSVLRRFH